MDPYVLLNVLPDADDATVKTAYVNATRLYPPEKNPEMFEAVRAAFETIATERQRLQYDLFETKRVDCTTLICSCLESKAKTTKTLSDKACRQILREAVGRLIEAHLETDYGHE